MQLKAEDLPGHVAGGLAPAYIVSGDETLLVEEACDSVIQAARRSGFDERSVLFADASFDWTDLLQEAASMSLFAERRIVDLRIPVNRLGKEASAVMRQYAGNPPDDTLLLVRMPRLDSKEPGKAWYKAFDDLGVTVRIWNVELNEMPGWLARRLEQAGLELERPALALLAERVEGNLLAAVQEVEKLRLAGLESPVTAEALARLLEDSARYDTFQLLDAVLAGDAARVSRMTRTLREEGVAVFAIIGALAGQLRRLVDGGYMPARRKRQVAGFLRRIGSTAAVDRILAECALADAQGKGQLPGDAWLSAEELLLRLAGVRVLDGGSPMRRLRS